VESTTVATPMQVNKPKMPGLRRPDPRQAEPRAPDSAELSGPSF